MTDYPDKPLESYQMELILSVFPDAQGEGYVTVSNDVLVFLSGVLSLDFEVPGMMAFSVSSF